MEIKLTKNLTCIVDDEDLDRVSKYSWYSHVSEKNRYYAATRGKEGSEIGLNKFCYLHRFIMNAQKGQTIDHVNGNTLDNRKENLRFASLSQNSANSKKISKKTTSKYKGVHLFKRDGVWVSQIKGRQIGRFKTEKEAAEAYDKEALLLYGNFAKLNAP